MPDRELSQRTESTEAELAEKDARAAEYGCRWAPSLRMPHEIDFEAGWNECSDYFRAAEQRHVEQQGANGRAVDAIEVDCPRAHCHANPGEGCYKRFGRPQGTLHPERIALAALAGRKFEIAWCPKHGLHGCRETCNTCGDPVVQVPVVVALAATTGEQQQAKLRGENDRLTAAAKQFERERDENKELRTWLLRTVGSASTLASAKRAVEDLVGRALAATTEEDPA